MPFASEYAVCKAIARLSELHAALAAVTTDDLGSNFALADKYELLAKIAARRRELLAELTPLADDEGDMHRIRFTNHDETEDQRLDSPIRGIADDINRGRGRY